MEDYVQTTAGRAKLAPGKHWITVCVPTYKRPQMLLACLNGVCSQESEGFQFSVVVVDNDESGSAKPVVEQARRSFARRIEYCVEPRRNIALARNRAVRTATGDYICFIDDDEIPTGSWLRELLSACLLYGSDGVLGPVRPYFPPGTPSWLEKSGLCLRPTHRSGSVLSHLETRTGNVLFKRTIVSKVHEPFPPEKGRSGGEDIEFFRRMIKRGHVFVWCEEAPVYEHISSDRLKRMFYIKKYVRIGGLNGIRFKGFAKLACVLRSLVAAGGYACTAGFGLVAREDMFVRGVVKLAYNLSRISGCLGIVPIRERE